MNTRRQSLVSLAAVLILCSCSGKTANSSGNAEANSNPTVAVAAPPASVPPTASEGGQHKLALLVGINNYKYSDKVSPLAGSLNDVQEMRQLLIGKFEFPPENIMVLTESQATHAGIISAIQTHLIAKAQANDIVVFQYSGHGSQMKDVTGKMISGWDETIVPYDSRDPAGKVFDISGAELHPLLLQLAKKTKNLTFILDSCHSGTMVRGATVRSVSADDRTPPKALPDYTVAATRELGPAMEETPPKFTAITAATSRESAFEHIVDGKDHGALTYFLTRQLRNAKASATYRDIMDNVIGDVTANYPSQHPSLEGAEADQYVFGDGSSLSRVYVAASPSVLTQRRVTLTVGQVQGATIGSSYDVYPPGSKKFAPPEKPSARVRLVSVSDLSSEATFLTGSSIAPASRAVEREHQYGKLRMRVFLDGVDKSATLQSIRTALQSMTNIELVERAAACNMQVRESGGKVQTLGADYTTLSTPVSAGDSGAVDRVVAQIRTWAKWFNVLTIANPRSEIELQFTITGSQTRDPMAKVGKPDMGVRAGEKIEAMLTNSGNRDVYVALLDLSSDGSISLVYPNDPGAKEVLKPSQKFTRTFTTVLPEGRSVVTDILKVFASYKPLDLRPLIQGATRDPIDESDPLQALLDDSSDGSRGIAPVLSNPVDLGTWTSTQRVLVVKKK